MDNIVKYKISPDLDMAKVEAMKEVAESGGARSFPVMIFKQGKRTFIGTVFPIFYIVSDLKSKPTEKDRGLYDVREAMNRPLDPGHAKSTMEYIRRNFKGNYILPAMTLNIQESINIYTADYQSHVKQGYMVIPYGIKLSITDGQHRRKALENLCKDLSQEDFDTIKNDGISVMITAESNMDQMHQDFADCSKTKELPKSLIAVYDKRNPANSLVIDLIDKCPLFKNKVDATSSTLSKKSTKLFLVSQVRSCIKELLLGSAATGDAELERRSIELYKDSESEEYKRDIAKFIDFFNQATEKIPILNEVAQMTDSINMTRLPELRSEYLLLNSGGINILCRIGYLILREESKRARMGEYIDMLAQINWKKNAEMWSGEGNVVTQGANGLKISTSNSATKMAVQKLKETIGLEAQNALQLEEAERVS